MMPECWGNWRAGRVLPGWCMSRRTICGRRRWPIKLAFFALDVRVVQFPAWDCLPYDRVSPSQQIVGRRIATLSELLTPPAGPRLVLTNVQAVTQKIPLPEVYRNISLKVRPGAALRMAALQEFLVANG